MSSNDGHLKSQNETRKDEHFSRVVVTVIFPSSLLFTLGSQDTVSQNLSMIMSGSRKSQYCIQPKCHVYDIQPKHEINQPQPIVKRIFIMHVI